MQVRRLMLMILPLAFAGTVSAQQATSHTLVFAVYEGKTTAKDVLASMRKAERAAGERIESYAVVAKSPDGKISVQERPTQPNPAIEAMLGEPSATGNAIRSDVVDSLRAALTPGTSAVIAVLDDRWVKNVARDLQAARARATMFTQITEGESR